jgi:nucleoside-diphosphate-sugar epimerase
MKRMYHCLVTGGAGFIGSHLVDELLRQGYQVRVLDNLSTGHLHNLAETQPHIEFIEGDIRDRACLDRAVEGIDYIFHLAAMVSVPESLQKPIEAEMINAVGTLALLSAASEAQVKRLIFSSTCAVYGDEQTLPKTETMLPQPKSPYAISKLTAEHYCLMFNVTTALETVVLRNFNVYGPRQDPSSVYSGVISIFVDHLSQQNRPFIFGDGEQTRDFIYVEDVVKANLVAAESAGAAGRVFNIGTGRPHSINTLFDHLTSLLNVQLSPIYRPERAGDIRHSVGDIRTANRVMGWTWQVPFEEGLLKLTSQMSVSDR